MIAYKYCGVHGVAILKNLELKITPPNQFNDPFEFTPRMLCSNPLRRTRDILKNKTYVEKMYRDGVLAGKIQGSYGEFRKHIKLNRNVIALDMSQSLPKAAADTQRHCLDLASKRFGVLCMSNRRDSILMWGHYSNKHQGLVIGFDVSNDVFQSPNGRSLRPVNYVRERIVFDATWKESSAEVREYEQKMVFSKNEDWRYEGELRQLFELPKLKQKLLDDGTLGYFLPIPAAAVLSVTLGTKCSAELEKIVCSALAQGNLSHVKLNRAVLHESEYALKFIDI